MRLLARQAAKPALRSVQPPAGCRSATAAKAANGDRTQDYSTVGGGANPGQTRGRSPARSGLYAVKYRAIPLFGGGLPGFKSRGGHGKHPGLRRFRGETHPSACGTSGAAADRRSPARPRLGSLCDARGGYWGGRRLQNGDCPPLSLPLPDGAQCRWLWWPASAGCFCWHCGQSARISVSWVASVKPVCHAFCQLAAHGGIGQLGHRPAAGTDHQQIMRRAAGVVAGAPGIDGVQAVDQALVHQEIQRPDRRSEAPRRGALRAWRPAIRAFRLRPAQQQFQHLAADGREAASALRHSASATLSWAPTVSLRESGRSGHGGRYLSGGSTACRARDGWKVAENLQMRAGPGKSKSIGYDIT